MILTMSGNFLGLIPILYDLTRTTPPPSTKCRQ